MTAEQRKSIALSCKPVTLSEWPDLQQLFGESGVQRGCWCMYWRLKRAEFSRNYGEANRRAMEAIIAAGRVPGILAYRDGQAIAWCSVAPREEFPVLDRSRTLRRVDDQAVWSIVCFFVARPYRRQRLTDALIRAAVAYAGEQGARIVEAYPIVPEAVAEPRYELYTGVLSTFEKLGFQVVARRSARRSIMRYHVPQAFTEDP